MSEFDSFFDDVFQRFFGPGSLARPPVQRVDLGRLLTDSAKQLVATAGHAAQKWGNADITPDHLLYAAATTEPTRSALADLGLDADEVARQMQEAAGAGDASPDASPTLSPAAKLALRTAQQHAAQAGQSYISPENILVGIAATPDTAATKALARAQVQQSMPGGRQASSATPHPRRVRAGRHRRGPRRKARPGRGARRRDLPNRRDPLAPPQEQSRTDR